MQGNKNLNEQHRSFLNKRGITDTVIDAFSISTQDVPSLGLHNAITIPVNFPDGTHNFNKYRRDPMEGDVKPKYLYEKGGKITLYGADKFVAHYTLLPQYTPNEVLPVVLTEGELDTLVCWSQGIPAMSSTGGAMSFQDEWVETLKDREVFICFDNDEAGYKGAIKVLGYLPNAKVVIVPHQLGVKDISDYVARGGNVRGLLTNAYSLPDIETAREYEEKLANNWQLEAAKFFSMYIEANKPQNIPSSTTGGINLDPKTHGRLEAAKSVPCETLLPWKRAGRYMKTQCLWHSDSDPSLTLYRSKNNCYCFVCDKYADAVDIVMARDNVDFKAAIAKLLNE